MKFIINIFRWFFLGIYTIITIIPKYLIIGIICLLNPKKGAQIKYKGKPIIPIIMMCLSLLVYFICIFLSTRWYVQRLKINYLNNDIIANTKILEQEKKEIIKKEEYIPKKNNLYDNIDFLSIDFKNLLEKNNETVGWIKVNNTNVNYPIVQHNDNSYYLKHDFYKKNNINGWVFGDYRDNFEYFGNNTIIYAHNMIDRKMFGSLIWCFKESWYQNEENLFIKISTPKSNTIWKIFSMYTIIPETYYLKTYFENEEKHLEFLNILKNRSVVNFSEEVSNDDKILTLSTCTDDGTKRAVIHAKMVKVEYR